MKFGSREIEIQELDADQTVKLIKFVGKVFGEIQEDQKATFADGLVKGSFRTFIDVLLPGHLYKLTAILLNLPEKLVKEHWTLSTFTEVLAELAENNDLADVVKNLQRVAASYQS